MHGLVKRGSSSGLAIFAVGLACFLTQSAFGLSIPFASPMGINTDELAHLSYALQLRDNGFAPLPLDALRFYDPDTRLATAAPNYVTHSAAGYYPLAAFLAVWPDASLTAIRLFCSAPALAAYIVYLALAARC